MDIESEELMKLSNDDSHRSAKHASRTRCTFATQRRYSCVDEKSMKSWHALTVSESPRERRSLGVAKGIVGSRIADPTDISD